MQVDPFARGVLSLAEAARRLPRLRDDRPVHVSTLWRWATTGLGGVRLESTLLGGVRVTTESAVREFIAATNAKRSRPPPGIPDQARRDRDVASELDRLGL